MLLFVVRAIYMWYTSMQRA